MEQIPDEVLLEAYERAKQENLNQDFILLHEEELLRRHLMGP